MTHTYMSEQEIREAEQRCQQATRGEWVSEMWQGHRQTTIKSKESGIYVATVEWTSDREENQNFIENARKDLPDALADLRELRRVVRELSEKLKRPGMHDDSCGVRHFVRWCSEGKTETRTGVCTCGVDAALALAQQVEGGK